MRKIRQAQKSDLDRIQEIVSAGLRQCVLHADEHFEPLYTEICKDVDWALENNDRSFFWITEAGDSILGVVLVKDFWNLSMLFVDPDHHRSGIARQLLSRAIDHCKDKSPKGCLMLNSSNHAASFYRKMGFTQTAEPRDLPGGCVPFKYKYEQETD